MSMNTGRVRQYLNTDSLKRINAPDFTWARRWYSIDPLQKDYPWLSPYNFCANNPIIYIDAEGERIVVSQKDQGKVSEMLIKTFGEQGKNFTFNENNELQFTGDPSSFNSAEKKVFDALFAIMTEEKITRVILEKNVYTETHGGEATATHDENGQPLSENIIYIDPAENIKIKVGEEIKTVYQSTQIGRVTLNPNDVNVKRDANDEPISTGQSVAVPVVEMSSLAARFFHGIGHVLYTKGNEKENIIALENTARSIMKKVSETKREKKLGPYTSAPEPQRKLDASHKNETE